MGVELYASNPMLCLRIQYHQFSCEGPSKVKEVGRCEERGRGKMRLSVRLPLPGCRLCADMCGYVRKCEELVW